MKNKNKVMISFEVSSELKEKLRYGAFINRMTMSEYIRSKLEDSQIDTNKAVEVIKNA